VVWFNRRRLPRSGGCWFVVVTLFPSTVQAFSRFPDLSPSSFGSSPITGLQGSCGGVASSSRGGWWRFNVFPVLGCHPPRRRVRFFLTSADASFCSSQSGFFQDQNCLNYGSLSDLEVLFLNP
jgi:hypothetical protein